jgi:hypothetical protein
VTRKEKLNQLASDVRRNELIAPKIIKDLVGLLLDDVKDNLLAATGDETLRLQGEGRALLRLLTMMTREPPSIARGIDQ